MTFRYIFLNILIMCYIFPSTLSSLECFSQVNSVLYDFMISLSVLLSGKTIWYTSLIFPSPLFCHPSCLECFQSVQLLYFSFCAWKSIHFHSRFTSFPFSSIRFSTSRAPFPFRLSSSADATHQKNSCFAFAILLEQCCFLFSYISPY